MRKYGDYYKTLLETKHHRIVFGVDRMDFGACRVQLGFLLYVGTGAWEVGIYSWVYNVYLRWSRTNG